MDTKWKNSRRKRINITIITLVILAVMNVCLCPLVYRQIVKESGEQTYTQEAAGEVYENTTKWLYRGCYVLYYEYMKSIGEADAGIGDFYFPMLAGKNSNEAYIVDSEMEYLQDSFELYRGKYDYFAVGEKQPLTNTTWQLGEIFEEDSQEDVINQVVEHYRNYLTLEFDDMGNMQVHIVKISDLHPDAILKSLQRCDRTYRLEKLLSEEIDVHTYAPRKIVNFKVAYGIPENVPDGYQLDGGYSASDEYYNIVNHSYVGICYVGNLILLVMLLLIMTSNRIWKGEITYTRRGREYVLEIAVFLGGTFLIAFNSAYGQFVAELGMLVQYGNTYNNAEWVQFFEIFLGVLMILTCDYLTLLYIRPVFSLGLVDYIKEYSLLYRMRQGIKRLCTRIMESLKQVDLSEKASKTIFKFVAVNFVILGIMMCMWFMGIFGLLIYSIVLFFLLKKYYGKIVEDYQKTLNITRRIAKGEFVQEQEEDLGIFNSLKTELCKIEEGFQKAVEQETKSQRMKTELITNVSHDLKTPLTAITTYVELLKKEDITEDERKDYIDTLSRKSLRLKVLIEDLFEVSKASSQNIVLQYMDVDVINLMKQVYIEHEEKLSNMGLDIRWNVPDEKIVLSLDNQKTYRIFENLFVNIQKYAMPNSRVYIDMIKGEGQIEIVMKNISATELNVRPEELTERFVRGDKARNTEGSGLGLAIAKSFVEAQKGSFELMIDGDLFKAMIIFPIKRTTAAD